MRSILRLKAYSDPLFLGLALSLLGAVLFYSFKFPRISPDMSWYISHGYSILLGHGMAGPDLVLDRFDVYRGPVFPMLIAGALAIDTSPEAAYWVVKLGAILLPPTIFLFCYQLQAGFKVFETRRQGILWAAITVVGVFALVEVNFATTKHIDAWWIEFCLLSLILQMSALSERSMALGCLAGLLWSTGYLTKEASILFIPVIGALIFVVPDYRKAVNIRVMLTFLICAVVPIIAWFYYLYLKLDNFHVLGVQGNSVLAVIIEYIHANGDGSLWGFVTASKKLLFHILFNAKNGVSANVPLGLVYVLAWALYCVRAIKWPDARIILLATAVTLPVVAYNAIQGWGFRHVLVFYLLAGPAFGYWVTRVGVTASAMLDARLGNAGTAWLWPSRLATGISVTLISIWLLVQVNVANAGKNTTGKFAAEASVLALLHDHDFSELDEEDRERKYHRFSALNTRVSLKIVKRDMEDGGIPANPGKPVSIMLDSSGWQGVVHFYADKPVSVSIAPVINCFGHIETLHSTTSPLARGEPVALSFKGKNGVLRRARLLFAELFHADLVRYEVQYFIDTGEIEQLQAYLQESSAFSLLGRSRSGKNIWSLWKVELDKLPVGAGKEKVFPNVDAWVGLLPEDRKDLERYQRFASDCIASLLERSALH